MTFETASDASVMVRLANQEEVAGLTQALLGRAEVRNLHPAYYSLLIDFDPLHQTHAGIEALVREHAGAQPLPARWIEIPVWYDGPDLADVAAHCGLSVEEVVRLHSGAEYRVEFLGFSPGFPYLSGLPPELATPRLTTPRTRVPAGSVAIGGTQTGVYPSPTPGGWRIVGHTNLTLYPPVLLQMGDRIRFVSQATDRA